MPSSTIAAAATSLAGDMTPPAIRHVLHVGCGMPQPERFPTYFRQPGWREIRLDIDPGVQPDVIASITDLGQINSGSVDAIWSSHNLEHLNAYEVPVALAEFRRVLKPDGFAIITLPDLRAIARLILAENLDQLLYQSGAGPITPLDMLFGHQASLARGNHYMAHRTGFTATTLGQNLLDAGFDEVRVHEGTRWDLWAIAAMPETDAALYDDLARVMK
jgi:SAM-dependent methyltransferase